MTVAIIGLGLIGGSLARDLARRGRRVVGYDQDHEVVREARAEGVLAGGLGSRLEGIDEVDMIIIATPLSETVRLLAQLASRRSRIGVITDVGSTKRTVVETAEGLGLGSHFIGGHPLAGDHRGGWPASREGLFRGARVFLTPSGSAGRRALAAVHELWHSVGATPEEVEPAAHDEMMAWLSHLPQSLSTALALALREKGVGPGELGPGGRDLVRLAASPPDLWTEIVLDNLRALVPALDRVERQLSELRQALLLRDRDQIAEYFNIGQSWSMG